MSKPSLPKSLLSAYFDGEVSAEERAAVSRAAQKSPAAQQALDEYAQLSESLTSLQQSVRSPQLRDAVLASIQSSEQPRVSTVRDVLQRRWVQIAGGVLAASAAGMLLMFPFAGPHPDNAVPLTFHDAALPAVSSETALARNEPSLEPMREALELRSEPIEDPLGLGTTRSSEGADVAMGGATLNFEESDADEALERTASIPAEWLTQQVAKDLRTPPQPGDVMKYLLRVADETVVIPVTVVDVQMAAGQIRVLLARHGIQSLPMEETGAVDAVDESTVAILVESDWDRFPDLMDDLDTELDTEGVGVVTYDEWSPAAKRALVKQNAIGPVGKPAAPEFPLSPSDASPAAALLAESTPPKPGIRDSSSALAEGLAATPTGMFLQASVTDDFVAELDQRQQVVAPEANAPAIAESSASDRLSKEQEAFGSEGTKRHRFGVPFASHRPARYLFLIQKSGNAP